MSELQVLRQIAEVAKVIQKMDKRLNRLEKLYGRLYSRACKSVQRKVR